MSIVYEYIWLGGNNELRSKTRVINHKTIEYDYYGQCLPSYWNYDGSSTGQASGKDSEVVLVPQRKIKCPFRKGEYNFLVLCDTYKPNDEPLKNNHRVWANQVFDQCLDEEPWFGIEQEYFLMNKETGLPLGFDPKGKQGQYYCSVGALNAFGRQIADEHLEACLYTGLEISGLNAEVAPGQWEYQIGPCTGIHSGDELWLSRYILERVAEKYGVSVSWDPKPLMGDWNGSGCHTNYSTKRMRKGKPELNKTGLNYIMEALDSLKEKHMEHMAVYGTGNELRMTGKHETAKFDEFNYGVANRGASVRIGNETFKNKQGYFEDRRPSSNMDPYLVTAMLFKTTVVDKLQKLRTLPV